MSGRDEDHRPETCISAAAEHAQWEACRSEGPRTLAAEECQSGLVLTNAVLESQRESVNTTRDTHLYCAVIDRSVLIYTLCPWVCLTGCFLSYRKQPVASIAI